jgi:uncharacterized protein YndB with AHSA1/START domain
MSDGYVLTVGSSPIDEGMHMPMKPISVEKAKEIATQKGLKPGKVRGTTEVEFTRGGSPRVEIIDWPEFEQIVAQKGLEVHEGGGFMKLMKKQ